ncbi:MAG: hypothetical protein K5905_04825 [Roseibium sp.]|uniref:hypothetical protein n=1 Tax=Roseibium sp. TaxID=1936156 RepID=UPI00260CA3C1|nr:hypothetical protein [Roseibium sp.]MCV0424770.1 hypothetical protein [Roseibium sp.]
MRPGSKTLAALWGFAEATLFFIVPDVLLSSVALSSLKKALWACLSAALAATLGGLLVWICANQYPQETKDVLLKIPGISTTTYATVRELLQNGLFIGMLEGAFSGVPYKIFAAEAGSANVSPLAFAVLSPAARLPRFVAIVLVAFALSRLIGTRLSKSAKLAISLALWALFYIFYFQAVGW